MTIAEARNKIKQVLSGSYDDNEIRNFTDLLFFHLLNYSKIEIRMKENEMISQQHEKILEDLLDRLTAFEPIQYVLGEAAFFDLTFKVSPYVLIPRSETEELVDWVLKDQAGKKIRILDIGTGSGCIAVTLARKLPLASIYGCDNHEKAVEIAQKNADINGVNISFFLCDMLNPVRVPDEKYHVLVSNPPYVRESEKALMHANVLNYEPHQALFVPDADPLLYYRAIADLGHKILVPEGSIYCEINENLPEETLRVFSERSYKNIRIQKDINGKHRMIRAVIN
jgi:release factor glutamine methyltransferase